jgi:hypothetical protein
MRRSTRQVAPIADPEMLAHVQAQLRAVVYYQVGAIDGGLTPKGKTEDALLAFCNKNCLALTPVIDDEFLAELAKAQPLEVAGHRANPTEQDLQWLSRGSAHTAGGGLHRQAQAWRADRAAHRGGAARHLCRTVRRHGEAIAPVPDLLSGA